MAGLTARRRASHEQPPQPMPPEGLKDEPIHHGEPLPWVASLEQDGGDEAGSR